MNPDGQNPPSPQPAVTEKADYGSLLSEFGGRYAPAGQSMTAVKDKPTAPAQNYGASLSEFGGKFTPAPVPKPQVQTQDAPPEQVIIGTAIDEAKSAFGEAQKGMESAIVPGLAGKQNLPTTITQALGVGAKFGNDIIGSAFKAVYDLSVPKPIQDIVSKGIASVIENSPGIKAGIEAAKQGIDAYNVWKEKNPDDARTTDAYINIPLFIAQFVGLGKGAGAVEKVAGKATEEAGSAVGQTVRGIQDTMKTHYVTAATEDWSKQGGAFIRTKKIMEGVADAGGDVPKFLSERGISPQSLVEGGKFNTAEVADKLREDAGKLAADSTKPALRMADSSTPNIPLDDWKARAEQLIRGSRTITEGDKASQLKQLDSEFEALSKKYPDGDLPVSELDAQKSTYWKNTKFALDTQGKIISQTNGSVGEAAKQLVEEAVPDLPIAEMNKHLTQYYRAAEFLESLDNKVFKQGLGAKITNRLAKWGGAILGETLTGGAAGGIGGYMLGNTLTHALENASNPLRDLIMSGIKVENPEAYKALKQFMSEEEAAGAQRLGLPGASHIPLGPKTGETKSIVEQGKFGKRPPANFGEAEARAQGKGPGGIFEANKNIEASKKAAGIWNKPISDVIKDSGAGLSIKDVSRNTPKIKMVDRFDYIQDGNRPNWTDWYHGTTRKNAISIVKSGGFNPNTYHGGDYPFTSLAESPNSAQSYADIQEYNSNPNPRGKGNRGSVVKINISPDAKIGIYSKLPVSARSEVNTIIKEYVKDGSDLSADKAVAFINDEIGKVAKASGYDAIVLDKGAGESELWPLGELRVYNQSIIEDIQDMKSKK